MNNKDKTALVPKLRFPEFSGDWQVVIMKDICTVNQGLQIKISERKLEQVPNSYFYITHEFLKQKSDVKYYIENPQESVLCNEDDILMTRTGNTGQVVTGISGCFHNNFFKINYNRKQIIKKYLIEILTSKKYQDLILTLAGSSTIPDLNHGAFYSISLPLPCLKEQQKVADCLSSLDDLISGEDKKLHALKIHKKGLMQNLFPSEGETVPELRFPEFRDSGEWDEKTLGEVGFTYSGLSGKTKEDFGKGKPFVTYMNVYKNTIANINTLDFVNVGENESQNKVVKGDVLFTTSSETQDEIGMSSYVDFDMDECYLNSFCFGFRLYKNTSIFYGYYFRSYTFRKSIIPLAQGVTRYNLSKINFLKLKIILPKDTVEQQKIADCLSSLDDLIAAQVNKIENLKLHKKALMQGLFPSINELGE